MLFNSLDYLFLVFFCFILYWFFFKKSGKGQNLTLLVSSIIFYCVWDWRFVFLLFFSAIIDFFIGQKIVSSSNQHYRKKLLYISIFVNLGTLFLFKYYGFFLENLSAILHLKGIYISELTLNLTIPLGISFYTFQTLAYTIDCYRGKTEPSKNILNYLVFVTFFPQLIAGPIERASDLLVQFKSARKFENAVASEGLKQILWGLFKKIVIADNCAQIVDMYFSHSADYTGISLFIGVICFSIQIYCDFSGYSDIAIGSAKLFGINLSKNFNFPYFSINIREFWARWHISLTKWFRDYVYIPLGGKHKQVQNILIVFLLSGFWHGAKWTFITWGFLHAIWYLLDKKIKQKKLNLTFKLPNLISIPLVFCVVSLIWIPFRAQNIAEAWNYFLKIITFDTHGIQKFIPIYLTCLIIVFFILEFIGRKQSFPIKTFFKKNTFFRYTFYLVLLFVIFYFGGEELNFIYFQF